MKTDKIRQWGEEIGRKYPAAFQKERGYRPSAQDIHEGMHSDNFGLAVLQIQATLEVAAQLAELRGKLDKLSSGEYQDVRVLAES